MRVKTGNQVWSNTARHPEASESSPTRTSYEESGVLGGAGRAFAVLTVDGDNRLLLTSDSEAARRIPHILTQSSLSAVDCSRCRCR